MEVVVEHKKGRKPTVETVTGFRNPHCARIIAKNGGRKLMGCGIPTGGAKGGIGKGRIYHHDRIHTIK